MREVIILHTIHSKQKAKGALKKGLPSKVTRYCILLVTAESRGRESSVIVIGWSWGRLSERSSSRGRCRRGSATRRARYVGIQPDERRAWEGGKDAPFHP